MRRFTLALLFCLCFLSAGAADALAHPATGIVVGARGEIYFSDLETVWRLGADGKLSVFRPRAGGRHVHELSTDEAGNVYGADITYEPSTESWISAVWRMTPDGGETFVVAPTKEPPRGLSIWRDREGNTYFVEQDNHKKRETLLLRRSPAGRVETFAGGPYGHADGKGASARFGSVGGMAFGRDGSLYLTDSGALRRVSRDGAVSTLARGLDVKSDDGVPMPRGLYGSLLGVAADAGGVVYVADHGNRRVLKVAADGKASTILRAEPPWSPTGVAAAGDGGVYVLEIGFTLPSAYSGPRVRHVSAGGEVKTLATIGLKESAAARMSFDEAARAGSRPGAAADSAAEKRAGQTAALYEANASKLESGVAVYFGLGLLAIFALAKLSPLARR